MSYKKLWMEAILLFIGNACNWLPSLNVGDKLERGQEMGYFLFGGSDIILIFQKGIDVQLLHEGNHLLMGEVYAKLNNTK